MKTYKLLPVILVLILGSCTYKEPSLDEPYAIVKSAQATKITHIDGLPVFGGFSDDFIYRVRPGKHEVVVDYGHEEHSNFGRRISREEATLTIEAEEGMCYIIGVKFVPEKASIFGIGYSSTSWKPTLLGNIPIKQMESEQER